MATFYSSSTDQRDPIPNLCLREPINPSYPDSSVASNLVYLNYANSNPTNSYTDATTVTGNLLPLPSTITEEQEMGLGTQLVLLNGSTGIPNQGLSLSLGMQIPVPAYQYRPSNSDFSLIGTPQQQNRDGGSRNSYMNPLVYPHGYSSMASSVPNSKYLRAARELLDEVVNVREALKSKPEKSQSQISAGGARETDGGSRSEDKGLNGQDSMANSGAELSPSERQELQNKVTKLLAMLDEVDRRYKQYYQQMQIVVSSFDVIAGSGSSKPYTALALQTISRHFRSLRDAISGQITDTRKTLGEQETSSKVGGISRLRYIDQQIRQQRAMQQFGMMQNHAWRPQRGLPESSVSILRAWLFEHFLHPYPKDSEKLLLARQTGLTRSQVSNWFINARVRLWKPMIEDMYKEEFGADAEIDSNSSSDNNNNNPSIKGKDELRSSPDEKEDFQIQSPSADTNLQQQQQHTSQFISFSAEPLPPGRPHTNIQSTDGLLHDARFIAYQMADMGWYNNNGGVSLTLGLQHAVRGDEMFSGGAHSGGATNAGDFDYMNGEDRQRFGPSSQLLHDYVA